MQLLDRMDSCCMGTAIFLAGIPTNYIVVAKPEDLHTSQSPTAPLRANLQSPSRTATLQIDLVALV